MILIAVHGSASRFLPAERGTVRLSLSGEHDDRAEALRVVTGLHERFVTEARSFVHDGAATWWGSDQVRVRAERRYAQDGGADRTVQVATAELRVRFQDFDALSRWFEQAGAVAGVTIDGIEWTVTERRRREVQREVRVQAVQDATERAAAYGSAIGGTGVALRGLWEPGLRPSAGGGSGSGPVLRAMSAAGGVSGLELRPDDIEIAAEVTADFELVPAE